MNFQCKSMFEDEELIMASIVAYCGRTCVGVIINIA